METTNETWQQLEDGTMKLISSETVQMTEVSQEDLIADKEQQLLEMYNELQALKNNQ